MLLLQCVFKQAVLPINDVSDSAARVRHSQQEPEGMNKRHAGNDRKYILHWMKG